MHVGPETNQETVGPVSHSHSTLVPMRSLWGSGLSCVVSPGTPWDLWDPFKGPQNQNYYFLKIIYLFIYFWLCWVLVAARRIFVAACRLLSCVTQTQLQHVDS